MGSHRYDVHGAFSSGDAENGWEDCRLIALWNDDLLHLIRMGFSNMEHEDYPQRVLLWGSKSMVAMIIRPCILGKGRHKK